MVGEAIAGLSAFKTMFDMAKALQGIHDATARDRAVIELQKEILAAQAAQTALLQRVGELEKQVAGFETWETEKQRYELKKFGNGFAFVLKADAQPSETPHEICANCYSRGKKSFLAKRPSNLASQTLGTNRAYRCPECRAEI
jgi:hypothetical protein